MCGIVGYVGKRDALPILTSGLELLEYRGYDSAGVAILGPGGIEIVRVADPPQVGTKAGQGVAKVRDLAQAKEVHGYAGIGHTRWGTHGPKTEVNAHPHIDCPGRFAVVHNGQVANYQSIKTMLEGRGHSFRSDTDTEVIPHLIEELVKQGLPLIAAVQAVAIELEGAFTFLVLDREHPTELYGVRQGGPLIIGLADHGALFASDEEALAGQTKRKLDMHDGEVAIIRADGSYDVRKFDDVPVSREVERVDIELTQLEKGAFTTFMMKEIYDQPGVVERVLEGRLTASGYIKLGGLERHPELQRFVRDQMTEVVILGCGTSLYAGYMIVRFLNELGITAHAIDAAEFVHSPMPLNHGMLIVPISQSGETRDVIEAMDKADKAGLATFALCNKPNTQLTKYGSGMYLQAGTEKAVASTKAFVAQVLNGGLLGLALAQIRGQANALNAWQFGHEAAGLSEMIGRMLTEHGQEYYDLGRELAEFNRMFYIGRGYNRAVALEGALKMMEIAETDAHGMLAAAMKHGPLSLVHPGMVVVAVCLPDPTKPDIYAATIDNVHQALTNGGQVIAVIDERDEQIPKLANGKQFRGIIRVPHVDHGLLSVLGVVPLQLMALGAAEAKGLDPDRPRGLAKSVTVR